MTGSDERWTIRPARPEDAEAISAVQLEAGLEAWSYVGRDRIDAGLRDQDHPADLVATDGNGVLAFVAWDSDTGEITHLMTHPRAWGRGAGTALLARACEALLAAGRQEAWLYTEERNAAIGFYESLGWRERGEARVREWHGVMLREPRLALALAAREMTSTGPD